MQAAAHTEMEHQITLVVDCGSVVNSAQAGIEYATNFKRPCGDGSTIEQLEACFSQARLLLLPAMGALHNHGALPLLSLQLLLDKVVEGRVERKLASFHLPLTTTYGQ